MSLVDELAESRIHFFTGKGGVGKSTVVAALGVALAERGRRPLLVELGHRASMSAIFAVHDVEYRPREVAPGVFAMNIELEPAIREYITGQIRVPGLAGLALASKPLRRFLEAAPAVAEVATLKKLEKLERERRRGAPRYDPILVDLDATGHALMFFELPRVFEGIARSGPLRVLLDSFASLLSDPARASLHVVTIPSELPVNEALEFCEIARSRGQLDVRTIIVNRVPPRPPRAGGPADPDERALRERFARRRTRADAALERLGATGLPVASLPETSAGVDGATRLRALARAAGGER